MKKLIITYLPLLVFGIFSNVHFANAQQYYTCSPVSDTIPTYHTTKCCGTSNGGCELYLSRLPYVTGVSLKFYLTDITTRTGISLDTLYLGWSYWTVADTLVVGDTLPIPPKDSTKYYYFSVSGNEYVDFTLTLIPEGQPTIPGETYFGNMVKETRHSDCTAGCPYSYNLMGEDTLTVDTPGTKAKFSVSADTVCVNNLTPVNFINQSKAAGNYLWDFGNGTTSTEKNPVVLYDSAGTYMVTLIAFAPDTFTTKDTAMAVITVTETDLTILMKDDTLTCIGDSISLIPKLSKGNAGQYLYEWNTGNKDSFITTNLPGTYTVTVTDSVKCAVSASAAVSTNYLTIDVVPNQTICKDDTAVLTAAPSGGAGNYNYNWSTGSNDSSIAAGLPGTYTVTVTDSGGCAVSTSAAVSVIDITVDVPDQVISLCVGDTVVLTAVPWGGAGNYNYSWSTGDTTSQIFVTLPGTYFLTVQDTLGCIETDTVSVSTLNAAFTITEDTIDLKETELARFSNTSSNASTYLWKFGDNTTFQTNYNQSVYHPYKDTGIYTITLIAFDNNLCTDTATATIWVINTDTATAVPNTGSVADYIKIYPNPAKNTLTIMLNNPSATLSKAETFILYNLLGQKVKEITIKEATTIIGIQDLNPGLYFYNIAGQNEKITIIK